MRQMLKQAVRQYLHRRGLEILSMPSLGDFLASRNVEVVLDVGANVGQFALQARQQGFAGDILSFEPVASVHAELAARARADRCWQTFNCAVGSRPDHATIHVSRNSVYSSIKPLTGLAARFDPATEVVANHEVEVVPLDSLTLPGNASRVFLKIDTQGFEQEVLLGAQATLARCVGVQLELPAEHLYAGVWDFSEGVEFMRRAGFVPAQIRPVNSRRDDPASVIEFDCVFRRAG